MNAMRIVFAAVAVEDVLDHWGTLSAGAREQLILLGVVAIVTMWLVVWALFFRKSHRRRHRHHHGHHSSQGAVNEAAAANSDGDLSQPRERRKWRRRRREHHPRNPTLAETGGLPPAREGDPPEILP
jgi:hypothetical protein